MGHVYGDSSPFPYDYDFIDLVRSAVSCGVDLLVAQEAIAAATQRARDFDDMCRAERARLDEMTEGLKGAMAPWRAAAFEGLRVTANRVLEAGLGAITHEVDALQNQLDGEIKAMKTAVAASRDKVTTAIARLLGKHDLPYTETSLRFDSSADGVTGRVRIQSPFGVEAGFSLAIPSDHRWSRPPRVGDFTPGAEVHVTVEKGLFGKKPTLQTVKLEKLVISEVDLSHTRVTFSLRRGPKLGAGWRMDFDLTQNVQKPVLQTLGENGEPEGGVGLVLDGPDAAAANLLREQIVRSTAGLGDKRQLLLEATFDGKPLSECDDPRRIAENLVGSLAPIVQEIARRSGAPGELVLRRDVGEGRREELFVSVAELMDKVAALPEPLRKVFDPFGLSQAPRSPRAPVLPPPLPKDA